MVKAPGLNESSPRTLREFLKFLKRLFAPSYMSLLITLYLTPTSLENRIFPISKKMCTNWTFLGWESSVSRWTELTLSLPTSRPDHQRQRMGMESLPCCGGVWLSTHPFLCSLAAMSPLRVCGLASPGAFWNLDRAVNTNSILSPEVGEEAGLPLSWLWWSSQPPGTYWAFKEHT